MTKSELIQRLQTLHPHLSAADCEKAVDTVFNSINDVLVEGGRAELRGFGAFFVKKRDPRVGRNPRTGASVSVPSKRVPFFKTGKKLHDDLNPNEAASPTPSTAA